jgi:hypothetical protein
METKRAHAAAMEWVNAIRYEGENVWTANYDFRLGFANRKTCDNEIPTGAKDFLWCVPRIAEWMNSIDRK